MSAPAPVTNTQFRGDFPEFADVTAYPDAQLTFYLTLAQTRLDPCRWGSLWSYGVKLYTAHSLSLARGRAMAAAAGGTPGATTGIVASKSVGGVSKSMDIAVATTAGAGTYNLTAYGSEYYALMRQVGIGGIQVGATPLDPTPFGYDGYWGGGAGITF